MNRNALVALIIILVLLIAGFVIVGLNNDTDMVIIDDIDQTQGTDGTQNTGSPDESPVDWERYVSEEFNFTLYHHPEAEVSVEGPSDNYVKFAYIGPESEEATEITDGDTLTVGVVNRAVGQSLEAFAEAEYNASLQAGESIEAPTQVSFGSETAYRYRTESLGTVTHYILDHPQRGKGFHISYNMAGEYEADIQTMLDTFRFATVDGSASNDGLPTYTSVEIALLDTERTTDGEERGCDYVVMSDRSVTATTMPLTAAMEELFSIEEEQVDGYYNFIARTNDTLSFDSAVVEDGTAYIYLEGEVSGYAGVCDNPRAQIQIEETAEQFVTVDDVVIYLNGEETDLQPNMRGN